MSRLSLIKMFRNESAEIFNKCSKAYELGRADERAKTLEEFRERLEKHQQDNWVDNLEYGITLADIDEVIEEMKCNK